MIEVCQRDAGDPPGWLLMEGGPVAMIWTNPPRIGDLLAQKLSRWLPLMKPTGKICVLIGPDEWPGLSQWLHWPAELKRWRDRTHLDAGAQRRMIELDVQAHTAPGDLIVDPFCGFSTTGAVAKLQGRSYYGCDINPACVARSAALLG